jgi:hypothetical protein
MDYIKAFKDTNYIVNIAHNEAITINVGKVHKNLDTAIKPLKTWAFITAYNPLPKVLSDLENTIRNNSLKQDIESLGLQLYTGYGIAKDKSWKEESFFITGIDKENAIKLGVKYGQLAIVIGKVGLKSELIVLK